MSSSDSLAYPEAYDSDIHLKKLAYYLRSSNGVKVRPAQYRNEGRVEYFKG